MLQLQDMFTNQPKNKSLACWRTSEPTNPCQPLRCSSRGRTHYSQRTPSISFEKPKNWVFSHVEINTNGLRLKQSVEFCKQLKAAGVSTIYLQFDGLTADVYKFIRGVDLLETKMKAIQNLREAGFDSIVLVVTLVKGINDGQLGDIVNFAVN
jgi:hypothetical protein